MGWFRAPHEVPPVCANVLLIGAFWGNFGGRRSGADEAAGRLVPAGVHPDSPINLSGKAFTLGFFQTCKSFLSLKVGDSYEKSSVYKLITTAVRIYQFYYWNARGGLEEVRLHRRRRAGPGRGVRGFAARGDTARTAKDGALPVLFLNSLIFKWDIDSARYLLALLLRSQLRSFARKAGT